MGERMQVKQLWLRQGSAELKISERKVLTYNGKFQSVWLKKQ